MTWLLNSWNIFSTLSLSWCNNADGSRNSRGPDIRPCGNPHLSNMALDHCPSIFNLLVPTWLVRTRPAEKGRRLFGLKEKRVGFFFHIHGNLTFANDWGRTLRYCSGGERRVLVSDKTIMIVNVKEWGANVIWRSSCPRVPTLAFAVADVNVTSSFTMMWHSSLRTVTAASNNSETEL